MSVQIEKITLDKRGKQNCPSPRRRAAERVELAQAEGGTVVALQRHIEQRQQHAAINESTAVRYLKEMNFTFKRYRYSLKKPNQKVFDRAGKVIGALSQLDRQHRCELLYFDESGFSPNPPVQYGWTRIGQTRAVEPLAHRQRVNVLAALRHDGQLIWLLSSGQPGAQMSSLFLIR